MVYDLKLRPVLQADLPLFFEHQADPEANRMAAFAAENPNDHAAFLEKWTKILANDDNTARTVEIDGQVAGNVSRFPLLGKPSIGYWIGRTFWGRGIATRAVHHFLPMIAVRPLHARVAKDNVASLRVLAKNGFAVTGEDRDFAHGRGREVEEFILTLS